MGAQTADESAIGAALGGGGSIGSGTVAARRGALVASFTGMKISGVTLGCGGCALTANPGSPAVQR